MANTKLTKNEKKILEEMGRNLKPHLSDISRKFDIPVTTLYDWWRRKQDQYDIKISFKTKKEWKARMIETQGCSGLSATEIKILKSIGNKELSIRQIAKAMKREHAKVCYSVKKAKYEKKILCSREINVYHVFRVSAKGKRLMEKIKAFK